MIQRLLLPAALGAALLVGAWLLWTRATPAPRPAAPPTATAAATASPAPSPTEPVGAEGFRVSGTAVGEPTSYAAVESPDGSSRLYRGDETVPGLGRIAAIHTDRIVVVRPSGETLVLRLKPAPTPTRDRRGGAGSIATTPRQPARDRTPGGSPSSDAPDRPAS